MRYKVESGTNVNGRPTFNSTQAPWITVVFDGQDWIFTLPGENETVIGQTVGDDESLWPAAVADWMYIDKNGDILIYSGGELNEGVVECQTFGDPDGIRYTFFISFEKKNKKNLCNLHEKFYKIFKPFKVLSRINAFFFLRIIRVYFFQKTLYFKALGNIFAQIFVFFSTSKY
jgi:hypothetical protein